MTDSAPTILTEIAPLNAATLEKAAALIRDHQLVAIPSETVYGLAARADSGQAVTRIYEAKQRPSFNPLIVHVAGMDQAEAIAQFDNAARTLAARYWPGPLTLVLPLRDGAPVASLATAGLPTVAIRMPAHPAMRALIEASGLPVAAPSANASGMISPTKAAHVALSLDGRIPLIVDAGATKHGLESTIVAVHDDRLTLLRPGPISSDDLAGATGLPITSAINGKIVAPGQLASHYAPRKPLRLNSKDQRTGEWLIGFGPISGNINLSITADLSEAAARLFDLLHEADQNEAEAIAVAPIPDQGIGIAINDRLRRAAAPRD